MTQEGRHTLAALACFSLVISPVSFVGPAAAMTTSTQPAGQACGLSQSEMLAAIAGKWTFKQGPGVGVGGVLPFPLPAHKPQAVHIEFDEEMFSAVMKQKKERMALIPVASKFARQLDLELTERQQAEFFPADGDCGWASTPVLIGSTSYDLIRPHPNVELSVIQVGSFVMSRCTVDGESTTEFGGAGKQGLSSSVFYQTSDGDSFMGIFDVTGSASSSAGAIRDGNEDDDKPLNEKKKAKPGGGGITEFMRELCDQDLKGKTRVADMMMTLTLRFTSENSATGFLDFRGKTMPRRDFDASLPFFARAKVSLTR